jgi:signal transduction histidine kinase
VSIPAQKRAEAEVAELVDRRLREVLHEIRQPLSAVFALAEMARTSPGADDDVRTCLDHIIHLAQEVSAAAATLLEPARHQPSDVGGTDLGEMLDSVLDVLVLTWSGTLVRVGQTPDRPVVGDRAVLRRCLVNLVDNAVRAAGPEGRITVTVQCDEREVHVILDDNGPGFGRVPSGNRMGLELTRRSLTAYGGELRIGLPSPAGGARVVLSVPVARSAVPPLARRVEG